MLASALRPRTATSERADTTLPTARRLEDWIVRHLDDALADADNSLTPSRQWPGRDSKSEPAAPGGWGRLQVSRRGNILLVRLAVASLIKETVVAETAAELHDLIASGASRIVLNLAQVERLASSFVATLASLQARCALHDGGALRICGLRDNLTPLFNLTHLDRCIMLFPDEASALSQAWPERRKPHPLPISLFQPLGSPQKPLATHPISLPHPTKPQSLVLLVDSGRQAGLRLPVHSNSFLIGRDDPCQLRCRCETVSRQHARIESTPHGWTLVDLGSRNGTKLNGTHVTSPLSLQSGDVLQVGPLRLIVELDGFAPGPTNFDDNVVSWLVDSDSAPASSPTEATIDLDAPPIPIESLSAVSGQRYDDVIALCPRVESEADLESLRQALDHIEQTEPAAQLVINLERAGTFPSRALGMLLALALRLEQRGGRLRFAQPQAQVRARLEWMRVHELVGLFTTLDDAIVSRWDS